MALYALRRIFKSAVLKLTFGQTVSFIFIKGFILVAVAVGSVANEKC